MEKILGSGFKLAQGGCSAGKPSGREDRRETAFASEKSRTRAFRSRGVIRKLS